MLCIIADVTFISRVLMFIGRLQVDLSLFSSAYSPWSRVITRTNKSAQRIESEN